MKGNSLLQSGLPKNAAGFEFEFLLNRDQLRVITGAMSLIDLVIEKRHRAPQNIEVVRRVARTMDHLLSTTDPSTTWYWQFVFGRDEVVELMAMFASLIVLVRTAPHVLNIYHESHTISAVRIFTDVHETLKWGAMVQLPGAAQA